MIRFAPVWITDGSQPLDASPVREGDAFTYTLLAADIATATVPADTSMVLTFKTLPGMIAQVSANGAVLSPTSYAIEGTRLTIDGRGYTGNVLIEVRRSASPRYSVITGEIPPGLSVSPSGVISGQLGNVPSATLYSFTVRASNGTRVRDRAFSIRSIPQQNYQTIIPNNLPAIRTDTSGEFDFYQFANLARADGFSRTFEVTHPVGNEQLSVFPSGVEVDHLEGLPPGIRLDGLNLKGTISASAPAGRYLFGLDLADNTQVGKPIIGEIIVQNQLATVTERPVTFTWKTPRGNIGEITEGYPSVFSISATTSSGKLNYLIAPTSKALPQGMRLNSETGEIEGIAPHVDRDTQYGFIVRIVADANYEDRSFSFTVRGLYTTSDILDVRMKLRNTEQKPLANRIASLIDPSVLYRSNDPTFGLVADPYMYLIKGVAAAEFAAALSGRDDNAITKNADYHGPIDLLVGRFKSAAARAADGSIIYEVVYLEMFDPQAKAGGFLFDTSDATEKRVKHAQTGKDIFPLSLRNARLDIVKDCSFPTPSAALRYRYGVGSSESMPVWMLSPQTKDDASTVLGYVPGIVVAHVLPQMGATIAALLNRNAAMMVGRPVTLDRYYLYRITYQAATTFDNSGTTFDRKKTVFDFDTDDSQTPINV